MIASSLFHFTKELDTLKLILENGIRSSYNFEEITDIGSEFKYICIPMVCFCDIPLKFIKHHTAAYGQYGIAFKKEWAIENGIQPLTYRIENSSIAGMDNLLSLIQDGIKKINTNESDLDKKFAPIQDIKY